MRTTVRSQSLQNDETTAWAHRLDHYYKIGNTKVHFLQLGISLSVITVAALAAIVPVMQGLDKDISKIRQAHLAKKSVKKADTPAASSVSGVAWRKIANDVFRIPDFAVFLAVMIGIGC